MSERNDHRHDRPDPRDVNRRHEEERRHAAEESGNSPTPTPTPRDVAERSARSRNAPRRDAPDEGSGHR
ncbi:hypothetical protein HZZ00_14490 [Streptomyces sp. NEAU-sy36]|uniref:hypothetical protein n=1 Tax=unclassified Streptomyces TaxID=2593676 RepID=UPI0015D63076|nr:MULTISPECIES: hypothetical protein [unclassified Streptomyces]QLJ02124.1 hypothetical protein HZZ00_14490 [Streptomyces sp. NEAU-sy36]